MQRIKRDKILKGLWTSLFIFAWEGLYPMTNNVSNRLSFNLKSSISALKVTILVYFPRKTGCCSNHLSIRILRAILLSTEYEVKKFIVEIGSSLIIRAKTKTRLYTVEGIRDRYILNSTAFSRSTLALPFSKLLIVIITTFPLYKELDSNWLFVGTSSNLKHTLITS